MLRTFRRLSQGFFLLFFIYLTVTATYPLETLLPREIFLRFNPFLAFVVMVSARVFLTVLPLFAFAGITILLTLITGRSFCGWVCPFGTTLDVFDFGIRSSASPHPQSAFPPGAPLGRFRKVKYLLLTVLVVLALFGVQAGGWFDPLSLATRTYGLVFFPFADWALKAGLGVLARVPVLGQVFAPVYDFLRDQEIRYVFRDSVFRFSLGFLLVFGLILALQLYQKRFWCRALCPLGALLGLLSRWRLLGLEITHDCTDCKLCEKVCPVGAIEGCKVSPAECTQCYTCVEECPAGAIQVRFGRPVRKEQVLPVLPERRAVIKSVVLGALLTPLFGLSLARRKADARLVRPPGAREEDEFLDRCIRCGECMKVCPNNALHPTLLEAGVSGLWTPRLIPSIGYCQVPCAPESHETTNLCAQVCPSGAIRKLTYEERLVTRMGTAYFDKSKCIPYVEQKNCGKCEEHCPIKAIKFRRVKVELGRPVQEGVVAGELEVREVDVPYVEQTLCIGCGQCEHVCPVAGEAAIRVGRLQVE